MPEYIEYKDSIAFHPGYYVKELIEESGMTQEDYAKRLGTTPKNLSLLVRGEQSLSVEMASKLSKMLGTSMSYWLNLQNAYDEMLARIASDEEMLEEKAILKQLGYDYFRDHFGLPALPRKLEEQVAHVRGFLKVASLTVLRNRDLAISFRGTLESGDEANVIKANAMTQIAVNKALTVEAPKFNKAQFGDTVDFLLTQTCNHKGFYPLIKERLLKAGVIFVVLPNLPGSMVNGATKKIGDNVLLMVNDRHRYADSFWFTLLHEVGHVMHGDYGISCQSDSGGREDAADEYARDKLVDSVMYSEFIQAGDFSAYAVRAFAERIGRDPGIVVGRLQKDGYVRYNDSSLNLLRCQYRVKVVG